MPNDEPTRWDDPKSDPIADIKAMVKREMERRYEPPVWLHHPQCDLVTGKGECNCQPLIAR